MDIENPILNGKNMFSNNYGVIDDDEIVGTCDYCTNDIQETQDYVFLANNWFCDNICKNLFIKQLKEEE